MSPPPLVPGDLLNALSDAAEIGLCLVGADGRVALWNQWMAAASGIGGGAALGCRLDGIFPELAGSRVVGAVDEALADGLSAILSSSLNKQLFPLRHTGRQPARVEAMQQIVVVKPLAIDAGRACLVQVFDVTNMAHRETLLRQQARTMEALAENYRLSELHNRAIVDNTADAIVTFGEDGAIGTYNPAAERIFGYDPYDIVGKSVTLLIPELAAAERRTAGGGALPAVAAEPFLGERREVTGRRKIRTSFPLELSLSAMELGGQRLFVAIGHDITERKLAAARIQHLAHHDALTGLPNRVLFHERLRQALAQGKRAGHRVALMFLDLDNFKVINDTLGHHVGDLLLKAVAKRLQRCVRETDTVARLGGDEFAVVLTNLADPADAGTVAEAIIASVADPFGLDEHEVLTSTSIGVTIFPDDADDADPLLRNADLAMFRSKAEGRNNYHFYIAEMDAEVQARKVIERDLRLALGTEQLELHYQPLVDVKTRAILGCEALLRWRHPTRGWLSPAEFIPVAERSDLIQPLGRWILHRACLQAQAWTRSGLPPLKVAVNLSPAQFKNSQALVAMVGDILDQTGMPSGLLQLEITEGIAMQNVDETIEVLRQLRSMGAVISIDDFGTGYSSLNYLKRFPVDKLKIDRSFVVDIGRHPGNEAVVKAIVDLGHSLGTRVNVEGVETRQQLEFLIAHKVDEAQGFYFSRALPPDDFARLVRTASPWPAEPAD